MPIILAMLVVAACSTEQIAATTSSSVPGTSSTTLGEPSTTSSSSSTTTTTTTLPPTTTTTLLEGIWAEQPVVTSGPWHGVLGWWDGSAWIQAEEDMDVPIDGGEDYQIALLGTEGRQTTGGTGVIACDIHPDMHRPGVELADPDLLAHPQGADEESSLEGVAVSAGWDLTPHHVGDGEAHPDLEAVAIELLADRGFESGSAEIVQTVDSDLDGDGFIETIVVVEETELANESSGVYSLVFVVSPDAAVVAESVIPADQTGFPASFRVGAVADLNGDRSMEIVLDGEAWENSWLTVYELVGSEFVERIGAVCGV